MYLFTYPSINPFIRHFIHPCMYSFGNKFISLLPANSFIHMIHSIHQSVSPIVQIQNRNFLLTSLSIPHFLSPSIPPSVSLSHTRTVLAVGSDFLLCLEGHGAISSKRNKKRAQKLRASNKNLDREL